MPDKGGELRGKAEQGEKEKSKIPGKNARTKRGKEDRGKVNYLIDNRWQIDFICKKPTGLCSIEESEGEGETRRSS